MTKLAIAAPSKVGIGPLMTGTVAQDSVSVNQWNLEALSVNDKHISPNAITTEKISVGAITTVTIADGTITGDKVAAATITGNKISAATIEGSNVKASTITSGLINVSTLSAISANLGTITAGTINLVDGANTGIYISPTQVLAKVAGTTKLNFDVSGGTYYMAGEILADKITITANAANSIDFGSTVTINGDLKLTSSATVRYLRFNSALDQYIYSSGTSLSMINTTANGTIGLTANLNIAFTAPTIYLYGEVHPSSIVVQTGAISGVTTLSMSGALSGATTISASGSISGGGVCTFGAVNTSGSNTGIHKTVAGNRLANGTYTFGGAYTFTMTDGLVTATNATGPT